MDTSSLLSYVFGAALLAQTTLLLRRGRTTTSDEVRTDRRVAVSRPSFVRVATAERARAVTLQRDLGLVAFDIDHLARINEDHGHAAGDHVLSLVEAALLTHVRRTETLLSAGGGSWSLLVPDQPGAELHGRVELIRNSIQRRVALELAEVETGLAVFTLSAGTAVSTRGGTAVDDLFQAGDQAVLAAKLQGGNRTADWGDATRDVVRRSAGRRRVQRDAQLATVLSLAEALDLRDAATSSHSRMVGFYAELMAQGLGMSPAHVERVRISGLLHDIGKIGVPDSVLHKPAKLDDAEWAQMQRHPEIGARLLASIDAEDIRSWVLAHHERPDGRGYPYGVADAEIPLEAKILSVADAYEAMTADRVYRSAPGPEIARAELDKWRGAQFDSRVVDVFLEVLDGLAARDRAEPMLEPAHPEADLDLDLDLDLELAA